MLLLTLAGVCLGQSTRLSSSSKHRHHHDGVQLWRQMRSWAGMVQQLVEPAELEQLGMTKVDEEVGSCSTSSGNSNGHSSSSSNSIVA
jgi:hypothetical protein